MDMYAGRAALSDALGKAMRSDDIAGGMDMEKGGGRGNPVKQFAELGASAAKFLQAPDGPSSAMLELGGWDTHSRQATRLSQQFRALDAGLAALKTGLGSAWQDTTVFVMSEFGRTANFNGSNGTDHGTAGTAFALGGAVRNGRIAGDWPGLEKSALYKERDLFPANDAYAVLAGLLAGQFGFGRAEMQHILPGITPMSGLL